MTKPWFRFYRKTVNNPKAQKLSPELFRAWVNILCATDDEGRLPAIDDLAFTLRVAESVVTDWLSQLTTAKLFNVVRGGAIVANDWSEHNYESDVSTERVKRFRKRSRSVAGNAPDTESDTEQNQKDTPNGVSATKRGTRWPAGMWVPDVWITDGHNARMRAGLPQMNLRPEAEKFANYWDAKTGKGATKLDWRKTWINWCLNAKGISNGTGQHGAFARISEKLQAAREEQERSRNIRET